MLSLMSAACVTLLLALVESRNMMTAAPRAIIETAMATMISISVNPEFFFICCSLKHCSGELRDIADERVLPGQGASSVVQGDGDLTKARLTGDVGDGNRS